MSYSFSARGATRESVIEVVAAELDKVVDAQPIHAADREQAAATVAAFLAIVPDASDAEDYCVYVSGSISYTGGTGEPDIVRGASVNVGASLLPKIVAAE